MEDSALERVLSAIDNDSSAGAREYAIAVLMMAYGIRGISAAELLLMTSTGSSRESASVPKNPSEADRSREPGHEQALYAFGARDGEAGCRGHFAVAGQSF